MNIGDLVSIVSADPSLAFASGIGVYLGYGKRGMANIKIYEAFLWKGRIATFDPPCWKFEVINESR